MKKLLAKS